MIVENFVNKDKGMKFVEFGEIEILLNLDKDIKLELMETLL